MTDEPTNPEEPPDPKETAALTGFVLGLPAAAAMTPIEIFRDFNAVFRTDQGLRVLAVILSDAQFFAKPPAGPVDPYRLSIHAGERSLAQAILNRMNKQPPVEKPTTTKRTKR